MTAGITGTPNTLLLTWGQMWGVLQNGELDLGDATLEDENEAMEYANQGIREASALINSNYADYFLTRSSVNLTLVNTQDTIALPANIFASKIRNIVYTNGATIYEVKRIKEWHKFLEYRIARLTPNSAIRYRYFLANGTAGQNSSIILTPPAQESGAYLETWYLRRANEFASESDVCDIPEFVQYIYDHIRVKTYEKEGNPNLETAQNDKEVTKQAMLGTLAEMVPDHDTTLEADLSSYMEHS